MSSCQTHSVKRRLFKDAGRACPIDYRIAKDAFAGAPKQTCDILYVVGGLYGNPFALDAVEKLIAAESQDAQVEVVFNGDAHWFDKTAANFKNIEQRIQKYTPLVGNVEAELRRQEDVGVGCGCAYPECTTDESVSRSNRIHKMLSIAVDKHPELKRMLEGRPATITIGVDGKKIGITHGDEKLIGGWDCSRESLQDVMRQDELDRFMEKNDIDVFVTTHTCAPVALTLARGAMINNGAAGLPNFEGNDFGLCVRIANSPLKDALFETELDGLWIQAIPVRYDNAAYIKWFDNLWSETSPAAVSYRERIISGPEDHLPDSLLGGFKRGHASEATGAVRTDETSRTSAQADVSHTNAAQVAGATQATGVAQATGAMQATGAAQGSPNPKKHRATERDVAMSLAKLLYFEDMLGEDFAETSDEIKTLQVNITAQCNMACTHCHHGCNPKRTEAMSRETLEAVLKVARDRNMYTIDITGGAPEMHPDFEWFIREAAATVPHVMVRTNLTILSDPQYSHLLDVYEQLGIEVVASLPNVFAAQADAQRGRNTFDSSIAILKALNKRGYGKDATHVLDLVFNPQEPVLPPEQVDVEKMYRERLHDLHVEFDHLFAVANNPIGKYGASLIDSGAFDNYMDLLIDSFNPETCDSIMCRHQLSVGWDGAVYDCDFNLALGLKARDFACDLACDSVRDADDDDADASGRVDDDADASGRVNDDADAADDTGCENEAEGQTGEQDEEQGVSRGVSIMDYANDPNRSLKRAIRFGNHCYACTAGFGSSCGGTLVQGE